MSAKEKNGSRAIIRSEPELTLRQARFALEYARGTSATQAAIKAGYSEKGAKTAGARLLANVRVKAAVAERHAEFVEAAGLTPEFVASRLMREARLASDGPNGARVQALGLLGKSMAMFTDRTEHAGSVTFEMEIGAPAPEQLEHEPVEDPDLS